MPNVKQFGVNENVCNLSVNRQEISFKNGRKSNLRDFYYFPDNFPFYSVRIGESSENLNVVSEN